MSRDRGTVRVIAGELRGTALSYPRESILRPTMTRTKESVFNTVAGIIDGKVFLDLYCAAGGMGIEALSRGASFVHFVEEDPRALSCLEENLGRLPVDPGRFRVHRGDALALVASGAGLLDPLPEIVYADPPYRSGHAKMVLAHLDRNPYSQLELLIIEHERAEPEFPKSLRVWKEKRFGDTVVTYFEPAGGLSR